MSEAVEGVCSLSNGGSKCAAVLGGSVFRKMGSVPSGVCLTEGRLDAMELKTQLILFIYDVFRLF